MNKLIYESVDSYIVEAGEETEKTGLVRRALKYAKTAPARALRKQRARSVMEKYKIKIQKDIDISMNKYASSFSNLIEKIENRIIRVDNSILKTKRKTPKTTIASKINLADRGEEEYKAKRYDDILQEVRNSIEDILKKAKDASNKIIEHYAKAINDRIERVGTLTGVEFYPEEKTMLINEWKNIEDEVNVYIENKLVDFIDNIQVSQLEDIKAQLKSYVEDFGLFHSNALNFEEEEGLESNIDKSNPTKLEIWNKFRNLAQSNKLELNKPYKMKDPSLSFMSTANRDINKSRALLFEFVISEQAGALGIQFFKIKSGNVIPASPFYIINSTDNVEKLILNIKT